MNKHGLVSSYTAAKYRTHKVVPIEAKIGNALQREFNPTELFAVVVSDLTYVRVDVKWNYVCLFIDLFNREIIGHSCGANKTAQLVYDAIARQNHTQRS